MNKKGNVPNENKSAWKELDYNQSPKDKNLLVSMSVVFLPLINMQFFELITGMQS